MAEKEQQLFKPESVAPWFTADVKLGSLAIHLETPSCFAAGAWNPVLCHHHWLLASARSLLPGLCLTCQLLHGRTAAGSVPESWLRKPVLGSSARLCYLSVVPDQ